MSSIAIAIPQSSPRMLPRGVGTLNAATAAERLDVSVRRVLQLCHETWGVRRSDGTLLAWQDKGEWVIREDADARLARIQFPEQLKADVRALTAAQREVWQQRLSLYQGWLAARAAAVRAGREAGEGEAAYLAQLGAAGQPVDASTLRRWHKAYRAEGEAGLVDRRWLANAESGVPAGDPMLAEAVRLYLLPNRLSMMKVWELASAQATEKGWKCWRYRTVAKHLRAAVPEGEKQLRRCGQKAFEDVVEPYLTRDYSTLASNEIWVSDHHLFDVVVRVGTRTDTATGEVKPVYARPWLTAWQDMRSRKIVGWLIRGSDPDTTAVLEALRRGCLSHGVPVRAYTDNGKDFDAQDLTGETKAQRWKRRTVHVAHESQRLAGIYAALNVVHMHAQPYHGQSKPIERFFGTLEDRFGRDFDTYCGPSTQEKPERLADILQRGRAPTLEEFTAKFAAWLEADYHQRMHRGDAMNTTPERAWKAHLATKRTADPRLLEVLLQRRVGPVKVGQNGVVYKGLWYGQNDLAAHFGQEVYLRIDDRDLSRVSIWSAENRFLAVVTTNRRVPALTSREDLRAALAEKRRASKAMKGARLARLRLAEDLPDMLVRAASERNARTAAARGPQPPAPEPNLQPVRSVIEGELEKLAAASELRKAAGAESLAPRVNLDEMLEAFEKQRDEARAPRRRLSITDILGGGDEESAPEETGGGGFRYHRGAGGEAGTGDGEDTATAGFVYPGQGGPSDVLTGNEVA